MRTLAANDDGFTSRERCIMTTNYTVRTIDGNSAARTGRFWQTFSILEITNITQAGYRPLVGFRTHFNIPSNRAIPAAISTSSSRNSANISPGARCCTAACTTSL